MSRPDERSNWPQHLVLHELGEDPNWGGEFLIDISSPAKRAAAAQHVRPMVDRCAEKGFEAVEFDNLDSWTRFGGTPLADRMPFGRRAAIAYAELLTDHAHRRGLAVAQKNTLEASGVTPRGVGSGSTLPSSSNVAATTSVARYTVTYGTHVIAIEYGRRAFRSACAAVGQRVSVVLRDVAVSTPGSASYRYRAC